MLSSRYTLPKASRPFVSAAMASDAARLPLQSHLWRRGAEHPVPREAAVERYVEAASRVRIRGHVGFARGGDERQSTVPHRPGERTDALRREAAPRLTPRLARVVREPYAPGRRTGDPALGLVRMDDERRDAAGDVVRPQAVPVMFRRNLEVGARGARPERLELHRRRVAHRKRHVLVEEAAVFPQRASGGCWVPAPVHRRSICERPRAVVELPRHVLVEEAAAFPQRVTLNPRSLKQKV